MHRKNSNTMQHFSGFPTNSGHNQMFYHHSGGGGHNNNNNYNKSSSYPNFNTNTSGNGGVLSNNVLNSALNYNTGGHNGPQMTPPSVAKNQEIQARDLQAVVNAFNESYRHSLNNLISMQQPLIMQQAIQAVAEATKNDPKQQQTNENLVTSTGNNQNPANASTSHDKNTIGDINSRLEFLCLQMTEQAIN